jgi:PEP-CTERM motif
MRDLRRHRVTVALLGLALCATGTFVRPASADIINFDAQAAGRGGVFTGTVDSPLVIGIATFTGGELLNNETNSVDTTGVYATISPNNVPGGYTNPLTITFSTPVSAFSILVTNNLGDTFTVADNRGGSSTMVLPSLASQIFTLPDTGITSVTVGAASTSEWDFAIDNVTFTPLNTVPEPSTMLLGGMSALAGLAYAGVRRRKTVEA